MAALALHHVLLVAAAAALGAGGWAVAGRAGARGLERGVGAVVLAAAAAGISALVLGLGDVGGPWAPAALAIALGLGATRFGPVAEPVRARRRSLAPAAGIGVGVAWFAWLAKHPVLGIDTLTYHLPEAILWAQRGDYGNGLEVVHEFPVQAYPLTGELLLAWSLGIGRSFGPALALTPLAAALLACAGWAGMRRLGVPRPAAVAAVVALLAVPLVARQLHGPHTDLPALAWLACCWCLVLAARDRTPVLALALVAAGLAIGTKTTVAPLALAALAAGAWRARHALRARAPALAAGAVAATGVGGVWFVRNAIEHGSPGWPFLRGPWGDPLPPLFARIDVSFLSRIPESLEGRGDVYASALAGALLLVPAALVAATIVRERAVALGALATAASVLVWANAPYTGRADDPVVDLSVTTVRYLLPAIAAATLTLALAARRARWPVVVLALAALWSAERTFAIPYPGAPSAGLLALGALAGVVVAALAARRVTALPLAAGAAVVALTLAADDLPARHARIGHLPTGPVLAHLGARGDEPVSFGGQMLATAAGERLERDLAFLPRDVPCARIRGVVALTTPPFADRRTAFNAAGCLERARPLYADPLWRVYAR